MIDRIMALEKVKQIMIGLEGRAESSTLNSIDKCNNALKELEALVALNDDWTDREVLTVAEKCLGVGHENV